MSYPRMRFHSFSISLYKYDVNLRLKIRCSATSPLPRIPTSFLDSRRSHTLSEHKKTTSSGGFFMLEKWYEFGKIDWVSELEYPEWTVKEVGRFLEM